MISVLHIYSFETQDNAREKTVKRTIICEIITMKFSKIYQIVGYSRFLIVHEKKFDYNMF